MLKNFENYLNKNIQRSKYFIKICQKAGMTLKVKRKKLKFVSYNKTVLIEMMKNKKTYGYLLGFLDDRIDNYERYVERRYYFVFNEVRLKFL